MRSAGFTTIQVMEPVSGLSAPVALWYPSQADEAALRRGAFTMQVARDAKLAHGQFGLVVISHGTGGTNIGHYDTAAALARSGYVVAAPQHPRDNVLETTAPNGFEVLAGRPRLVSAVIDVLLAHPVFGPYLVGERIGAIGFSKGGYTILTALGAEPRIDQPRDHCRDHPDDAFCGHPSTQGHPPPEPRPLSGLADARIRSAVLLAPATGWHDDVALSSITVPLLIYYAEHDEQLSEPYHALRLQHCLAGRPAVIRIAGAGHYAFMAPFDDAAKTAVGAVAFDPPGFDRCAFHDRLNREIITHFTETLK
jgi:predicted dienelactone hydrolase